MSTDYDAIILGSGFGGSVTALRLSQAGYKVLVLERGRRWQSPDFPRPQADATDYPRQLTDPWLWDQSNPERFNGWVDFRVFPNMTVAAGAGVGGGSLIYANVSVEAAPQSFEQGWPREITWEEITTYYQMVGDMLDVQKVPENQLTSRFQLVREGAQAIGEGKRFMPLELAVSFDPEWSYDPINGESPRQLKYSKRFTNKHGFEQGKCVHLGNCDIGCEAQAKNVLEYNYLGLAENAGAVVRPLHMAAKIAAQDGGYRVFYDRIDPKARRRQSGSSTGRLVILACGSLGSTELLLRCRDEFGTLPRISRFLGHNWSSNGDFLTPAIHERAASPTHGPTISGAIDFVQEPYEGERFFIQDGGFPDLLGNQLRRRSLQGRHRLVKAFLDFAHQMLPQADPNDDERDPLSALMPWFAQGQDYADGLLKLRRKFWIFGKRELFLEWDIQQSEKTIETIIRMHERLAKATGGKTLVPPTWTLFKDLITPHPLGGCNMSDPPGQGRVWTDGRGRQRKSDEGVVDHKGEVFGYRNLFVADGAVIPEAIGRNPSRTIAALAERVAKHIVDEGR